MEEVNATNANFLRFLIIALLRHAKLSAKKNLKPPLAWILVLNQALPLVLNPIRLQVNQENTYVHKDQNKGVI